MEHDLLQNVTERVWLFLPSQDCSIQFLHEEIKLPPPLFPPSLFHLPCALSSVPVGELGGFTKPPKSNKEFLPDKCSLSNCWTFARKNESKISAKHRGCKRCHWQDRILLSSVFFLPRLDSKELEEGKPWRTRTVSEEPQRWNSSESRGTTTVVGSKEMRAGERAAGTTPQSSVPSRAPAEHPRHTSSSQVCGTGCGTRPSAPAPGPAAPERCQLGCEGLPGLRGALPAALPALCFSCPLPYLPAASPALPLPVPAPLPAAPGMAGAAAGQGRGGAQRGGRRIHGWVQGGRGSLPEHRGLLRLVP